MPPAENRFAGITELLYKKKPLKFAYSFSWCCDCARRLLSRRCKVRSLYLEVTHRCNLACLSCYTCAGTEKADALTLEEQKDVARQAKEMGARVVSLSGSGEPLLYKHLFELIDYIQSLGMAVVVFTNGTTIDIGVAEALMSRKVITYFKLYSLEPDVFDLMVGKKCAYTWGQYGACSGETGESMSIPSGLKNLLDAADSHGARNCVGIETLITKMNCHTLPAVARLARALSIAFHLETPVMAGRAIEHADEVVPSKEDYARLYDGLVRIFGQEYMQKLRQHPCPVERNPVVWTNGDIGFCSSRGAQVGNVRNTSLKELFAKATALKARQDKDIGRNGKTSHYFRTCPSRQLHELKYGIPCDY